MSIYTLNFYVIGESLIPPKLRNIKLKSWLTVLLTPLSDYYQRSFMKYKEGDNAADYSGSTTYFFSDRVRYTDKSIYECIVTTSTGVDPYSTTNWVKLNNIFIACDERIKYSSQKILFEYALNNFFNTASVYITNNFVGVGNTFVMNDSSTSNSLMPDKSVYQVDYLGTTTHYATSIYDYTIFFPISDYNALGSDADNIIRSFADQYNLAGMQYNILTF